MNYEEPAAQKPRVPDNGEFIKFPKQEEARKQSTVNQLMIQIEELPEGVNSLKDARELYDLETASRSGVIPRSQSAMDIPSPRDLISRDSCLPPDTRNSCDSSGHVFRRSTCSR